MKSKRTLRPEGQRCIKNADTDIMCRLQTTYARDVRYL